MEKIIRQTFWTTELIYLSKIIVISKTTQNMGVESGKDDSIVIECIV